MLIVEEMSFMFALFDRSKLRTTLIPEFFTDAIHIDIARQYRSRHLSP